MKIVYIGGYTDKNNSHFINYKNWVQQFIDNNKKVIFVALGQEAGYFAPRLKELYPNTPYILDDTSEHIDWHSYDLIYLIGGATQKLKQGLIDTGFSLDKLNKNVVLLGENEAFTLEL